MKANRTTGRTKAATPPASAGRKSRSAHRRGSASKLLKGQSASVAAPVSAKPSVKQKPCRESDLQVSLPGTLRKRGNRWWWNVKLPGEERATAKPLKPQGADAATEDLEAAKGLALEMWTQALTETVERRVRAETSQTIAKLKAQFLEKVRDFSQVVEMTKARLEAETDARVEAEAKLKELSLRAAETTSCQCCGAEGIPMVGVKRIDSGQLLCPDCLAALSAEIERIASDAPADCHA